MTNAVAFAPGHISGFFQPVYDPENIYRTGSRGAGFSVSLGATSKVSIEPGKTQRIVTILNGTVSESSLIETCIRSLIGTKKMIITCNIHFDLPVSQGFGMSAASVLSTALALAECIGLSSDDAIRAAHAAEVSMKTGLGDVIGSSQGGFEIRSMPGIPPDGKIMKMAKECDMVLCVVDKAIVTKDVLSDKKKKRSIDTYGGSCTDALLENPTIEEFFSLSELFTRKTGLATNQVLQVIDMVKKKGQASMCMLGGSIFATGNIQQLAETLRFFGTPFVTKVDIKGARLISKND